jgi:hypothetical protein
MRYVTGTHALNLNCPLQTCGDWHQSGIQWRNPNMAESADSVFGDYGIEANAAIPGRQETYNAANHIRALLDLLEQGDFAVAQGMKEDFVCNDMYTDEIFGKVLLLEKSPLWDKINEFMGKEYRMEWVDFMRGRQAAAGHMP